MSCRLAWKAKEAKWRMESWEGPCRSANFQLSSGSIDWMDASAFWRVSASRSFIVASDCLDSLDLICGRDHAVPGVQDIGIRGIDVVGLLNLRALRGIHRIDAQRRGCEEVNARITAIGGLGSIERLHGLPGLALAQLYFGLRGERRCGMRIGRPASFARGRQLPRFSLHAAGCAQGAAASAIVVGFLRRGPGCRVARPSRSYCRCRPCPPGWLRERARMGKLRVWLKRKRPMSEAGPRADDRTERADGFVKRRGQ